MSTADRPEQQPTQRLYGDQTRPLPPRDQWDDVAGEGDWRAVDDRSGARRPAPRRERPRRGRELLFAVIGALIGVAAAFVIIALGTADGSADDPATVAAQDRIAALDAALAERDAQVAELETRVAEAEAAVGERAEDIEAQRQALDDRAAALDDRARALDEREAAAEQREAELAERERTGTPATPEDPAAPGDDAPIDEETAQTIIDRVIDQIREMFQGEGG
ncbi:MAG TPA: hypothetical protein VML96_01070 [Egibacteraceae bacterium]|nr:hypothetical protein [Egibacteraceae bacterium]